jgi:hemerythrin-like domain-containing protein
MQAIDILMNSAIKDVIDERPEVGTVLAAHGVGCVTCQVGTCMLKDVVSIHGLSPEEERSVMAGIAAVLAGEAPASSTGATAGPPSGTASLPAVTAERIEYSPPMAQLVDEHRLIKRWVALIPDVVDSVDLERPAQRQLVLDGIDFIRSYADHFHHAKEEDILFGYLDEESPAIKAFRAEHNIARGHARLAEEGVRARERAVVAEHLTAYAELLTSHIKREDEVLYPWMDRELTTSQMGELRTRFAAVDEAAGPDFTAHYLGIVERIEAWATGALSLDTPALDAA